MIYTVIDKKHQLCIGRAFLELQEPWVEGGFLKEDVLEGPFSDQEVCKSYQ